MWTCFGLRSAKSRTTALVTTLAVCSAGLSLHASAGGYMEQATRFDRSLQTDEESFKRFIVTYQNPDAAARSGAITADLAHVSVMTGFDVKAVRWLATGDLLLKTTDVLNREGALRLLREFALIHAINHAQPDYVYELSANDPLIPQQWHLSAVVPNTSYSGANGWTVQAGANVIAGWNYSVGEGVIVGILDSGYTDHPDILPNLAPPDSGYHHSGFDFVQDDDDQDINDPVLGWDCDAHDPGNWDPADPTHYPSIWHGTHVTGLAVAAYNNNMYGAGVAPGALFLPVRVAGLRGDAFESDIVDAIIWSSGAQQPIPPPVPGDPPRPTSAMCDGVVIGAPTSIQGRNQAPARVINLSIAGNHSCAGTSMQTAIDDAHAVGSALVVAAGNGNMNVSGVSPASCANVITVAATDFGGRRAMALDLSGNNVPYSNYGAGVTLAAPGGGYGAYLSPPKPPKYFDVPIISDCNTGFAAPVGPNSCGLEGTSMAAPLVSGLVAAMVSLKPFLTPDDVRTHLVQDVRPWGTGGLPTQPQMFPIGPGLMDGGATLAEVSTLADPQQATLSANPNPVVVPAGQSGGFYSLSWNVPGYSVVDLWVQDPLTTGTEFWYDGTVPAVTTQATHYVAIADPFKWRLTPHGQPNVVLKELLVTAQH